MPLQEAVPAPPIENLPAPAGGFEYNVSAADPEVFVASLTGAVATGTNKGRYVNATDEVQTLREVRLSVGTAPTGGPLVVDVNVDGTSAFSVQATRPQVAAGQKTGKSSPARAGDRVVVQPGGVVTVDVDTVGSTVAGSDLTVAVDLVKIAPNNREGILY